MMRRLAPLFALLAFAVAGCGSAQQQHRTLNWVTTVADPTYEMVVEACDEAREYIIDRPNTTRQEDEEAWDITTLVCDRAVAGFEFLRDTQLSARAAIEGGLPGLTEALIERALSLWQSLQTLVGDLLSGDPIPDDPGPELELLVPAPTTEPEAPTAGGES